MFVLEESNNDFFTISWGLEPFLVHLRSHLFTLRQLLGEQRGITSTNVTLPMSLSKALTSTAVDLILSLVESLHLSFSMLNMSLQSGHTASSLLLRNALIHLTIAGRTSRLSSSWSMTLWSTRSNPFLKSADNLTEQLPISRADKMKWRRNTKA